MTEQTEMWSIGRDMKGPLDGLRLLLATAVAHIDAREAEDSE